MRGPLPNTARASRSSEPGAAAGAAAAGAAASCAAASAFRLVAIDVDGTLADGRGDVSGPVEQAVRDTRVAGVEVVLVSGRPQVSALPVFIQLGLTLPLISSGGAFVSDPSSGRVISQVQPDPEDVRAFVELARDAGATLIYQTPTELYGEGSLAIIEELRAANRTWIEQVDDGLEACPDVIKVSACAPRDRLDGLESAVARRNLALSLVYSGPEYLEMTAARVSKGDALRRLIEDLGIGPEQVLVIGDAPNDISMFREAGLAVAMGNASAEVRDLADVVAPTLEEDGVAWTLRRFVLDTEQNQDNDR
jgi:Cof subfamily protein (haloacid dehalogenase superfamily)